MKPQLYQLKPGFAKHNNLLIYFVAIPLFETQKAVYLYGHGTTETVKMGICCKCGRTLTHPVSVELGIGPECGGHFHDWNMIGGYTKENIERLKGALVDIKFDSWVPKSQIQGMEDSVEDVIIPPEHPMLKRREDSLNVFNTSPNNDNNMAIPAKGNSKPLKYCEVIESKGNTGLNLIKIIFPYDLKDIERVKALLNRRFIPDQKCWTAPMTPDNVAKLKEWGFTLPGELDSVLQQSKPENKVNVNDLKPIHIPGLKGILFPYQGQGVSFIDHMNGRVLIADEMGLGKTIQVLAWLQLHPEKRPVIIIVPASLKLNWVYEALKWMTISPAKILAVYGQKPYSIGKAEIIVMNYDIVSFWLPVLIVQGFKVCVLDEIHNIKNSAAKRTKAVKKLTKGIPHVVGLSGTPIINRPIEAFNALSIINSSVLPNFKEYTRRFCGAHYNGFGWDFNGATNTLELHQLLINSFMIRRLKKDVLKELPDKMTSFVPIQIDNEEEYRLAQSDFINYIRNTKGNMAAERASSAETLTQINMLRQLAIKGKMAGVIDWITEFLESGKKLVLFATHINTIDMLMDAFPKISVRYDGTVNQTDRDKNVRKFQEDPDIKMFIGMLDTQGKPAGLGITLTAADTTATLENQWSPGVHDQADDRIHRIGQKNACTNYKLMAAGTIDEKFAKLLDAKRKVIDSIMDGKETDPGSLLSELINQMLESDDTIN